MIKPAAKKVKVDTPAPDPKIIDELKKKEDAIQQSLEDEGRRLNEIKADFRKRRVPMFAERNAVIKTLPGFWKQAVKTKHATLLT